MNWKTDVILTDNGKDTHIWFTYTDGTPGYAGLFGVNPAVDEFAHSIGKTINVTDEWWGTWWFIK